MIKVQCKRCGGMAEAETFEKAEFSIDHSVGRRRNIRCGTSIGEVYEIPDPKHPTLKTEKKIKKQEKPKIEQTKSKTHPKEKYL